MSRSASALLSRAGALPERLALLEPAPTTETLTIREGQIPALFVHFSMSEDYASPEKVQDYIRRGRFPLAKVGDAICSALEVHLDFTAPVKYLLSFAEHFALGIQEPEEKASLTGHLTAMRKLIQEARREGIARDLAGPQPEFRAWVASVRDHFVDALKPVANSANEAHPAARLLMLGMAFDRICLDVLRQPELREKFGEEIDSNVQRACYEAIVRPLTLEVARELGWLPKSPDESQVWIRALTQPQIEDCDLKRVEGEMPDRYIDGLKDVRFLRQFIISALEGDAPRFFMPHLKEALQRFITASRKPFQEQTLPLCQVVVINSRPDSPEQLVTSFDPDTRSARIIAIEDTGSPETARCVGGCVVCPDGTLATESVGLLMPEQGYSMEIKPLAHAIYQNNYQLLEALWIAHPELYSALRGDKPVIIESAADGGYYLYIPERIYQHLEGSLPFQPVTDLTVVDAARQWSEQIGEPYRLCLLQLQPSQEPSPESSPGLESRELRTNRALRSELRREFDRLGAPNFDEFCRSLSGFGVQHDCSTGKGSHSALFREIDESRFRATMCGSTRIETQSLQLGVIWDTLDCLNISLQEYLQTVRGLRRW